MDLWSIPSRADAVTEGVGFCGPIYCVLGAPKAPAFANATGRKDLGAAFLVERM